MEKKKYKPPRLKSSRLRLDDKAELIHCRDIKYQLKLLHNWVSRRNEEVRRISFSWVYHTIVHKTVFAFNHFSLFAFAMDSWSHQQSLMSTKRCGKVIFSETDLSNFFQG